VGSDASPLLLAGGAARRAGERDLERDFDLFFRGLGDRFRLLEPEAELLAPSPLL